MSFSFGFGGDDIDQEDENDIPNDTQSTSTEPHRPQHTISPKHHSLSSLLPLLPSQLTYNNLTISSKLTIPRRSLFDIRTQLMAEANPDTNNNDTLLSGLNAGDLSSGNYEGGFKTWECAIDLAALAATLDFGSSGKWHVLELGAGSAIPSLVLLLEALQGRLGTGGTRFTLCDYNEDVLSLCTLPNVLLSCLSGLPDILSEVSEGEDGDIDLEPLAGYLSSGGLQQQLNDRHVEVNFMSGSWGDEFVDLLQTSHSSNENEEENILILASETIYSPSSLPHFIRTIMSLLRQKRTGSARALIAAKKIYFGVGGGIDEFVRGVREVGGQVRALEDTQEMGVGRIIAEVTAGAGV